MTSSVTYSGWLYTGIRTPDQIQQAIASALGPDCVVEVAEYGSPATSYYFQVSMPKSQAVELALRYRDIVRMVIVPAAFGRSPNCK